MKIIFLISFSFLLSFTGIAQRNLDMGLATGTSYYLGDINPTRFFSAPGLEIGPIVRYNFNPRQSMRFESIYSLINGINNNVDANFTDNVAIPSSFNSNYISTSLKWEYSFFPYLTGFEEYKWSPYIATGLGYSFFIGGTEGENHFFFPFGIGTKFNLNRRLSAGMEWTFCKTFTDNIDGISDGSLQAMSQGILHSNDWYSFFGLFITYKFFKFAPDCPTYD